MTHLLDTSRVYSQSQQAFILCNSLRRRRFSPEYRVRCERDYFSTGGVVQTIQSQRFVLLLLQFSSPNSNKEGSRHYSQNQQPNARDDKHGRISVALQNPAKSHRPDRLAHEERKGKE